MCGGSWRSKAVTYHSLTARARRTSPIALWWRCTVLHQGPPENANGPRKKDEIPAAKQGREETEKEVGTPSNNGAPNKDHEVVNLLTSKKRKRHRQDSWKEPFWAKGYYEKASAYGEGKEARNREPSLLWSPRDHRRPHESGSSQTSVTWLEDPEEFGRSCPQYRPISKCKIIVGCDSSLQQTRLVKKTKIGQVEVRCTIPEPTVHGVVRGIPRYVQMDEFLKRIEWVSDSGGHTHSKVKVKGVSQLTFKDGKASEAIRVTFITQKLPLLMKMNKQKYRVRPYVAEVRRCHRCQRYGHTKRQCNSKQEVCQTCGRQGHSSSGCRATQLKCCNCGGEHSAGSMNCRVLKEWQVANQLRAESYMPMALAFQQAKKLVGAMGQKTQGPSAEREREQPLPSLSPAWRSDTPLDSRRSYASVVAPRPTPKPRRKRSEEGRPKPTPQPRERTQR